MIDLAQSILVVFKLTTFDLVVSFLRVGFLWFSADADQVNVAVQTRTDAVLKLPLGQGLHLSNTLSGVEVSRGKRKQDVVDGHELSAGTLLLLVVPQLHVL